MDEQSDGFTLLSARPWAVVWSQISQNSWYFFRGGISNCDRRKYFIVFKKYKQFSHCLAILIYSL